MIFDRYGRPVLSMRIQVNTVCNFHCFFCHMEGTGGCTPRSWMRRV